jgi:N-succinyldiaminopimelate aminotransferase
MANPVFESIPTTIFEQMSNLARQTGAINLGQGFPESPGPFALRQKAAQFAIEGPHQYPPVPGTPELRKAVSCHYRRVQGVDFDWCNEVTITTGASEALAATIFALLEPGDEVVIFEPAYDSYLPLIRRAGGVARFVSLYPPHWTFTRSDLEAVFSSRTKMVVFNNPMNPTGNVFDAASMELLAEFCVRFNVIALCDEVWESIVFGGRRHLSLNTFPGMRELTVKIGSAGKLFSLTGWKVGFVLAERSLSSIIRRAHQFLSFTVPPNLQMAVAWGLENSEHWFAELSSDFERSRDRLALRLQECGFRTLESQSTYFLNVDLPGSGIEEDDLAFCLRAVEKHGIAAIPVSTFCQGRYLNTLVRLCFAKSDDVLDQAVERLASARDESESDIKPKAS